VFRSDPRLEDAERRARAERRGMWAQGMPRPPTAERGTPARPAVSSVAGPFYGNVRSRVYHAPTCRNARCKNCTREFQTQEEAQAAGFRAAGDCLRAVR
jgi:micrococcal nuclease